LNDFCRKLITEWRKLVLPFADETIIVAVSGGADSTALTVALHELKERKKLNLRFVAAHFNHDLRGEYSERDELFVSHLTEKLNFELVLGKGKISGVGNLEQNAREKRYEFLYETAENLKASVVLTAHTMNDQAETFLMNLIRGSGTEGLGGIKPIRSLKSEGKSKIQNPKSKIQLVRPLLSWAKHEETENFCHQNEIEFCFDAMNEDLRFQRVRIRKILLPLLKDFNPKIVENLARTAELLRGELTGNFGAENFFSGENLALKNLRNLTKPQLYRGLRAWLENRRGDLRGLEVKHIEAIERLLLSRKSGKTVELPGGEVVFKNGGILQFQKTKVEK
jgi:tRNA(Ile)-lysidine synthase